MTKRMPCRICQGTEARLTDEDVTPMWVREILAKLLPDPSKRPPRTKVRVCQNCNAAMNSKFEIPSRSTIETLIRGVDSIVMADDEILKAAAWVTKTALVRSVADPKVMPASVDRTPFRKNLVALIDSARPSPATSVRIGYYAMEPERWIRSAPSVRAFAIPSWRNEKIGFVSGSLHCLYWEVVISMTDDPSDLDRLLSIRSDDDRLLRIWPPPSTAVSWPPPVRLNMAAIAAHNAAWVLDFRYADQKTWRGGNGPPRT